MVLVLSIAACASAGERKAASEFSAARIQFKLKKTPESVDFDGAFDGALASYVAFALEHSPEARASFEHWQASTLAIAKTRRLPAPSISFGAFIRRVETRVGAQRFKLSLSQTFPWPSKLTASADAAAARSLAARSRFRATMLLVRVRVASAYWRLWLIEQEHRLKSEHDTVLEALSAAVRGRLAANAATLADLNQIDLDIARHHDHRGAHHQASRKASAVLLAVLGVRNDGGKLTAVDQPLTSLPAAPDADLRKLARAHPQIETHGHLAQSAAQLAIAERAERRPRFRVGLDYIETAEAEMDDVPGSGKDPVIVSVGLSIPLWAGSYNDAEQAAKASARAFEATREAAERQAEAALEAALAQVRDAHRRIALFNQTLVPKAGSTLQAVLGSYQSGRATVAAVILAQRDLLELQLELARARAEHAIAWAQLEFVTGHELARKEGN